MIPNYRWREEKEKEKKEKEEACLGCMIGIFIANIVCFILIVCGYASAKSLIGNFPEELSQAIDTMFIGGIAPTGVGSVISVAFIVAYFMEKGKNYFESKSKIKF